jgi:hypothetical protein
MLWAGGEEMAPSSPHLTDGVPSIAAVQPVHVSTWIEASTRELDAPSGQAAPGSAAPLSDQCEFPRESGFSGNAGQRRCNRTMAGIAVFSHRCTAWSSTPSDRFPKASTRDSGIGYAGLQRRARPRRFRFARDSALEQDGFEPSVPLAKVSAPAAEGEMPKRSKGTAS